MAMGGSRKASSLKRSWDGVLSIEQQSNAAFAKSKELGYNGKSHLQPGCVTCNPSPLFSICIKPQDIIIRTLPSSNPDMLRSKFHICGIDSIKIN